MAEDEVARARVQPTIRNSEAPPSAPSSPRSSSKFLRYVVATSSTPMSFDAQAKAPPIMTSTTPRQWRNGPRLAAPRSNVHASTTATTPSMPLKAATHACKRGMRKAQRQARRATSDDDKASARIQPPLPHCKPAGDEAEQSCDQVLRASDRGIRWQSLLPSCPPRSRPVKLQSASVQHKREPLRHHKPSAHSSDDVQASPWLTGSFAYRIDILDHKEYRLSYSTCGIVTLPVHQTVEQTLDVDNAAPAASATTATSRVITGDISADECAGE
mmetsp:Transcript_123739/g.357923  ORF Transcript_123739/g.357923 Transcript_123739/m.357923 type:complete len:272 (-) Transcript_123739:22-837(-)